MISFFSRLFDTDGFLGLNAAFDWTPGETWLHIVADAANWLSFWAIAGLLAFFAVRRRDLPMHSIFWLFFTFILACGAVHFIECLIMWWPVWRLLGLMKLLTAIASVVTLIALVPTIPKVLALRSPHELEREIAERQRAEQALRESEALYTSLVESLPLNVFRKDIQGRIVFANQRMCDTVGKTSEDLFGKTDFDLFAPDLAEKYSRDDAEILSEGGILEEVEEHRTPEGKRIDVQVLKAAVHDSTGRIVGVQGMFWDVTERRRGRA